MSKSKDEYLINKDPKGCTVTYLTGEDLRCWLERTTPEQRKTVAGYERESFTPVKCLGHFDHKDRLWIGLERWIDYPDGNRDIQNNTLLVKNDGAILQSILHPIERSRWKDGDVQRFMTNCHEPASETHQQTSPADSAGVMALEPEPSKQKRRRGRSTAVLEASAPSST